MTYDNRLIASKLRRWQKYLEDYRLPAWEAIPDIGLYMEQVVELLNGYLDYLPPEIKDDREIITPAAINNYVRKKLMPEPVKKRYYRTHIAYLILICTLKQTLSLPTIKTALPGSMEAEELRGVYTAYAGIHMKVSSYFITQVRGAAAGILEHEAGNELATGSPTELIAGAALLGGLSRLLSEKLLLLESREYNDDAAEDSGADPQP